MPETMDAWATRVLTVCVVLTLIAAGILFVQVRALNDQLDGLRTFVSDSRVERHEFQDQQTLRACRMLIALKATPAELKELGCSSPR